MVERLDGWIEAVGPWGYALLGLAALIEYVFPPFPGDSVVLLGGVYAARGERPWPLVLLAVTLGSLAGAAADYWVGARLASRVAQGSSNVPKMEARLQRLARLRVEMERRGVLLLIVNRFLPGIRALIFVAAGASRMRLSTVLLGGGLSALLFNGAVIAAGFWLGGNAHELTRLFLRYQQAVYGLLLVAVLGLGLRWLLQRRRPS